MAREKICGIYKITCLGNGKAYVGQSVDIKTRWRGHKSHLRRNIHENILLQNAWNKYGEENFKFEILETCRLEDLDDKEIFYINSIQTSCENRKGFNVEGGGCKNTKIIPEYLRKKMRIGQKPKEVIQIDKSGSIIKEWTMGAKEVERVLGFGSTSIQKCCNNKAKEAYGYIWQYKDSFNIEGFNLENFKSINSKRQVCQISLEGQLIKTWDCIGDIKRDLGVHSGTISDCCKRGNQKTHKGFIWMYADDYEKGEFDLGYYKIKNNIPVVQLTVDLEYVRTWDSASQACLNFTANSSTILRCCKDISKTYAGFKWMYEHQYNNTDYTGSNSKLSEKKTIVQLDLENRFMKEWESQHDVEKEIGIFAANVNKCCKGIRKTTGGFRWMYLSDYEQLNNIKI